jgi:hypothetical protein
MKAEKNTSEPGMDGLETYRRLVKKPYVIEKLGMAVKKELDRSASFITMSG